MRNSTPPWWHCRHGKLPKTERASPGRSSPRTLLRVRGSVGKTQLSRLSQLALKNLCLVVYTKVVADYSASIQCTMLAAIEFFDRVAEVAEQEGHHPDLHLTSFRNVSITVSTHAVDGLTQPDIILAAKLDAVPVEYSPKWLREHSGQPAKEG